MVWNGLQVAFNVWCCAQYVYVLQHIVLLFRNMFTGYVGHCIRCNFVFAAAAGMTCAQTAGGGADVRLAGLQTNATARAGPQATDTPAAPRKPLSSAVDRPLGVHRPDAPPAFPAVALDGGKAQLERSFQHLPHTCRGEHSTVSL